MYDAVLLWEVFFKIGKEVVGSALICAVGLAICLAVRLAYVSVVRHFSMKARRRQHVRRV